MHNSAQACEDLLARLFTDAEFRARFRQDPQSVGRELGLDEAAVAALAQSDWVGLELAAKSYSHKRESYAGRKRRWWWFIS
jgi:putative modified peptide